MIYYINAIQSLVPNAQCVVNNNGYENIIWHDERPLPSKEAVDAEFTRLQAEYDAKQYQRDRASAYPSIQEQLDMLWHSVNNGTDLKDSDWFNQLSSVKQAHPKGQ